MTRYVIGKHLVRECRLDDLILNHGVASEDCEPLGELEIAPKKYTGVFRVTFRKEVITEDK